MRSLLRVASRLIPTTVIVVGCASGPGGGVPRPASSSDSAWAVPNCFVADGTVRAVDTVFAIGAATPAAFGEAAAIAKGTRCTDGPRASRVIAPVVVSLNPPPGADLRDLLTANVPPSVGHRPDVLVSHDPDLIAYVARRADYFTATLPWTSTYVLVSTRSSGSPALPTRTERVALARDAVRGEARGAMEPFTWLIDARCAAARPTSIVATSRSAAPSLVAYSAGDATARQLAERVVSLAGAANRPAWLASALGERAAPARTAAIAPDSIDHALASGRAAVAILAVSRDPRTPCGTRGNVPVPSGAVPLVDSRSHAIVRRGSGAAFIVAPDGSLHFIRQRR